MATTSTIDFEQRVGAVRRFNRLYTRRIGVLQDGFLHSPYSLAEARVLYELAHRQRAPAPQIPYLLRPPRPGDIGWIASRHGALYGEEYGWDERLEALTAEIVAAFVRNHDPKRERCWIAEREGENVGSVLLMRETPEIARLRLLLVEPKARGLGIGARLVEEALRFAREAHYRKVTLWTQSVLTAARRIYERAGFKLIHQETHDTFGKELIGETWELELR